MPCDLFTIKKLFESTMLSQPNLSIIACSMGLLLWIARPKARVGLTMVWVSLFLLLVASLPITGNLLGRPLEEEAGMKLNEQALHHQRATYIVVLNKNIAEAAKIKNELPNCKIIISCPQYRRADAETVRKLGIPTEDVLVQEGARDTAEQAAQLESYLKAQPFILSTSALHTPRAVLTFKLRGMNPIPAPYDFIAGQGFVIRSLCPSWKGWHLVNEAIHEYVGTLWLKIGGIEKKFRALFSLQQRCTGAETKRCEDPDPRKNELQPCIRDFGHGA